MRTSRTHLTVAATVAAIALAACGGEATSPDTGTDPTPSASMDHSSMGSESPMDGTATPSPMDGTATPSPMDGMHGDDHAMGSAMATPADEVEGDTVRGDFVILDTAPEGTESLAGSAVMTRTDDSTVVTLRLTGLDPERSYVSHVHVAACSEGAGAHYKHDAEAGDTPPNEIHLAFEPDADGSVTWTVENPEVAGDDAVSVVVHEATEDGHAPKIACADLS